MADAMMMFLGEAHGVNWYWAQPGEFENPGVYYWDGVKNVLCVPHLVAAPEAPAQASAMDERAAFEAWASKYPALEDDDGNVNLRYLGLHKKYVDFEVQRLWAAWQARAALAQKGGAA